MYFKLYFKSKKTRQVEDGLIEATSEVMAQRVGRAYCDMHEHRYVSVIDPVLARESEFFPLEIRTRDAKAS